MSPTSTYRSSRSSRRQGQRVCAGLKILHLDIGNQVILSGSKPLVYEFVDIGQEKKEKKNNNGKRSPPANTRERERERGRENCMMRERERERELYDEREREQIMFEC